MEHLPNGLHDTYVRILEKIEVGRSQTNKLLAQHALRWVAFARRPLTVPELQEAVAFDIFDDHWDADKIPDGGKFIGLCRGLIIRDQESRVRFAHHTVRQHLLRPAVQDKFSISPFNVDPDGLSSPHLMEYYFTNTGAEFHLAVICAAYLCFSDFQSAIVKASEERTATMRQIFGSGGPIAIPATIGLKRQLFQIPYRFLGGNGDIPMPEIDFSIYDTKINRRAPPELRNKHALLDYVAQYWPWHTKQWLSKPGTVLHLPPDVCGEQTIRQFASGKEIRLDTQIGCLPVFQKFWNLILHKNLRFEIRPWGLNQHYGNYGCQGCPPSETQDWKLERCRWSSLIHWAAEMGHVPLIQAVSAEIMDHLYHERYHHQTLKVACAHEQSELISYLLIAITRCVELLPGGTISAKPWSTALALRIHETPYLIADLTEFCCKSGALDGLVALMDFGEHIYDEQIAHGAFLKGAFTAASCGRLQILKRLLDSDKIQVGAEDATTMTLLHVAAREGHADVVEEILRRGSQLLNLQNAQRETPLILASQGGHAKVVQLLVEAGAKVLIEGGDLIALPSEASVRILLGGLGFCENVQRPTAIHFAAANGDHNVLSQLLVSATIDEGSKARGFSQLYSTLTTMGDKALTALDPLECATVYGHESCVELLLTYAMQLNRTLQSGPHCSRALHLAATMGHKEVVRLLLEHHADPDDTTVEGVTPLHLAADTGKSEIIDLLLSVIKPNEMETDCMCLNGRVNRRLGSLSAYTSLQLAIVGGHSEAVEKLIEHGADPRLEYRLGQDHINALQLAIRTPKARSATVKAVCVRGIPREVEGLSVQLSDHDLLNYAIESKTPKKLQTLFDLGLQDGHDEGPEREREDADTPYLVQAAMNNLIYQWEAIDNAQSNCLEVLLANCRYGYDSLMRAMEFTRKFTFPRTKMRGGERYLTERAIEILENKLTEMRATRASAEGPSRP